MMKVDGTNITMIRGDTEYITISCSDNQGNQFLLIEGDTIYLTVKTSVLTNTISFQKVVTQFQDGKAIIEILPQDTQTLKPNSYVYDIQLTRANGEVKTIVPVSKFIIEGDVTHV